MLENKFEIPIIASSDTTAGAINVSSDGSQFTIQLDDPIQIPSDAKNITISQESATVWWTVPNILDSGSGQNNLFKVVDDGTDSTVAFTHNVVIAQGLYDLTALNASILTQLANNGAPTSPALINMTADNATQKVIITTNYTGLTIDLTIANSIRDIIGFNSGTIGPTATKPIATTADNVAGFGTVNFFLTHSDIVQFGVRTNNTYTNVLDQVLIDVLPGSQIVSTPFRPPVINEPSLAGAIRNRIRFWLTDDSNGSVDTNSETWSVRLAIKYSVFTKL